MTCSQLKWKDHERGIHDRSIAKHRAKVSSFNSVKILLIIDKSKVTNPKIEEETDRCQLKQQSPHIWKLLILSIVLGETTFISEWLHNKMKRDNINQNDSFKMWNGKTKCYYIMWLLYHVNTSPFLKGPLIFPLRGCPWIEYALLLGCGN